MKKDGDGTELVFEKVIDLAEYGGKMGVWRVHIERCRERDKNARVMDKAVFDQLKDNLAENMALESMPYGFIRTGVNGQLEFAIVSGHHRIRAARAAQIEVIYVLATEEELSEDDIISKQLSHNALSGQDDTQVLRELWDEIRNIDAKTRSGIRESDFDKTKFRPVPAEEVSVDYEFECIKFMFLPSQVENFERVCEHIFANDKVYVMDKLTEFETVTATLRNVSKNENIRNVASILGRMCEIVNAHYEGQEPVTSAKTTVDTLSGVMMVLHEVTGMDLDLVTNPDVLKKYVGKERSEIEATIKQDVGSVKQQPKKR